MHQYFIEENIPGVVVEENENIIIEVAYTVNNSKFYCYKCQFGTDTAGHLKQHFSTDYYFRRYLYYYVMYFRLLKSNLFLHFINLI